MAAEWVKRWRYEVKKTRWPGVYQLRTGGFLVTVQVKNPKTGKKDFDMRVMPEAKAPAALEERARLVAELRAQVGAAGSRRTWSAYAASLFERKVTAREIKSAKGRERWASALKLYLVPAFGHVYCDELRYADVLRWRDQVARWIANGMPNKRKTKAGKPASPPVVPCSPRTANGWFSILRIICKAMSEELEIHDPAAKLADFDTSESPVHTEERPNAVPPEHVPAFLALMKKHHPGLYAMTLLGFVTGLRPSSLRPLRRQGEEADLKIDAKGGGVLLVRRSNSLGQEVMDSTKTGKRLRLVLPALVVKTLQEHVASLTDRQAKSDLLFPSLRGGMRSRSCLDKPFRRIGLELKIPPVSPKAMRRTNKDLARALDISPVVSKAISGHSTDAMHEHYSTAQAAEILGGLTNLAALVTGGQDLTSAIDRSETVKGNENQ